MAVTRYRNLAGAEQVQVGLPNSGGVDLAQQLARAAKNVAGVAYDAGAALAEQQGLEQGQKAGLTGKPDPRTGLDAITPFGRGYNSAAEAAYSAKVDTDISSTVETLALEHEADPAGMQFAIDSYGAAIHDSVPESYRTQVALMLKGKTAVAVNRAQNQLKIRTDNQILADHLESMDHGVRSAVEAGVYTSGPEGDTLVVGYVAENRRRLEAMEREGIIQATDVVEYDSLFRNAVEKGLDEAPVNAAIERLSNVAQDDVESAAVGMAAVWDSDEYTLDQKNAIQKGFETAVSSVAAVNSRVYAEDRAALNDRLARGDFSADIADKARQLYRKGAISVDGYESFRAARVRNGEEARKKAETAKAVKDGILNDPESKEFREGVQAIYDEAITSTGVKMGSAEANTLAIDLLRKHKVLPESVSAFTRVRMLSGTPEEQMLAARFYQQARNTDPLAFQWTGTQPKLDSYALQLAEADDAYGGQGDLTAITERIHKRVFEVSDGAQEVLKGRLVKDKVLDNAPDQVRAAVDNSALNKSWLYGASSGLTIPPSAEAQYRRVFTDVYMTSDGNVKLASEEAGRQVTSTWGVDTVNGPPRMIKYAPKLGPEVLREDIATDLRELGYGPSRVPTKGLSPEEETKYRQWMSSIGHTKENGYAVDASGTGLNYDYRGYFKEKGPVALKNGEHLTDKYKLPSHETFSNESVYAVGDNAKFAGSWNGDTYVPSKYDYPRVRLAPIPETETTKGQVWALVPTDENGDVTGPPITDPKTGRMARYSLPDHKRMNAAYANYKERMRSKTQAEFDKQTRNQQSVDAVIQQRQSGGDLPGFE